MTYLTAFPDFDRASEAQALINGGWHDGSWHNDAAPRFHCGNACLWLDYADASKSEVAACGGEAGQCSIEFMDNGQFTGGTGYPFATIKGALAFVYSEWIGYNPFADDPAETVETVAARLVEYVQAREG